MWMGEGVKVVPTIRRSAGFELSRLRSFKKFNVTLILVATSSKAYLLFDTLDGKVHTSRNNSAQSRRYFSLGSQDRRHLVTLFTSLLSSETQKLPVQKVMVLSLTQLKLVVLLHSLSTGLTSCQPQSHPLAISIATLVGLLSPSDHDHRVFPSPQIDNRLPPTHS